MAMIETTNLTKEYGDVTAVEGVDLTVEEGSIRGFVGHNGAGKSTTMQMLVGLVTPTEGEAYVDGEPAGSLAARRKLGYAPQHPQFYESMAARDYLVYMGRVAGVDGSPRDRADELLARFDLTDAAGQSIGGFSGGMQRKLSLAQALLSDPDLLILDEPTAELDPEGRAAIIDALKSMTSEGVTAFVSSHVLAELEQFVDTVTVLHDGQVATSGSIEEVTAAGGGATFAVDSSDNDRLRELLADHAAVSEVERTNGTLRVLTDEPEAFTAELTAAAGEAGLSIRSLERQGGLEEAFMELTDAEEEA
jgi:ABC-type multidrug transport system ATPase subunit